MRPSIILGTMVIAAVILVGTFFLKHQLSDSVRPSMPPVEAAPIANVVIPIPSNPAPSAAPAIVTPEVPVAVAASKTNQTIPTNPVAAALTSEEIGAAVVRLGDLSHSTDPQAIYTVLPDTTNANKEIRLAALEAVKQLGNKEIVPVLQQMAADSGNSEIRSELSQTSDFLTLPKLTETDLPRGTNPLVHLPPRHEKKQLPR